MTYDWATDAFASYTLARKLQREKLLREKAWKALGPQNDEERKLVKGNDGTAP